MTYKTNNIVPTPTTNMYQPYELGRAFAEVCSNINPESMRPAGLSITAVQHAQNLFFVAAAQRLPRTANEVRTQLAWTYDRLPDITPDALSILFTDIYNAAMQYSRQAQELQRVTLGFDEYARYFQTWGNLFIKHGEKILARNNSLFTAEDNADLRSMAEFVHEAAHDTERQITLCEKVGIKIEEYNGTISALKVRVDGCLESIRTVELTQQIKNLEAEIVALERELYDLKTNLKASSSSILKGAQGGLISLIIVGTIYAIKAAQIRRRINILLAERDKKVRDLEDLSRAQGALERMDGLFFELSISLAEASKSLRDLQSTWTALESFLQLAESDINRVINTVTLNIQINRMKQAVYNWETAGKITGYLLLVFEQGHQIYDDLSRAGYQRVPPDHTFNEPRLSAMVAGKHLLIES